MDASSQSKRSKDASDRRPRSWTAWWHQLFPVDNARLRSFLAGTPIYHYGVVFFVDPTDNGTLHAALPSFDTSEQRIRRNVNEVLRVLIELYTLEPELQKHVGRRTLLVRTIRSYSDRNSEICDRVAIDLATHDLNQPPTNAEN